MLAWNGGRGEDGRRCRLGTRFCEEQAHQQPQEGARAPPPVASKGSAGGPNQPHEKGEKNVYEREEQDDFVHALLFAFPPRRAAEVRNNPE